MVKKKQIELHQELSQFLSLNYEVINNFEGRLLMIFLLFKHAKKYQKTHFTVFAFEQLKVILAIELKKIRTDNKKFDPSSLEVGHAIILFAKIGFFEMDDLNVFFKTF